MWALESYGPSLILGPTTRCCVTKDKRLTL